MAEDIIWENSLSRALKLAKDEDKLVLVKFFSPT